MKRFKDHYKVTDSGCWEWTKARQGDGYGALVWRGRTWLGHRWSWTIHNGEIPDGLCVLHRCDNPPCVNPDHLFLGTIADNNRDMTAKGRHGRSGPKPKLTPEDAADIRRSTESSRVIGAKYKVSHSTILDVRRRQGAYVAT